MTRVEDLVGPVELGSRAVRAPSIGTGGPADGGGRSPRRRRDRAFWLVGAILPLALLALWQLISATGAVPAYRLPSPASVVQAALDMAASGVLGQYVAISVQRVLIGFASGATLGLTLGVLVGLSRWGASLLAPTLGGLRAVPSLAWLPLLILYLGINEDQKVVLVAIGALFPVYTTVAGALRHVNPHLVELGEAYGVTRWELLTQIQLPSILPSVVSGLRLALAQAWLFLVAAELIGASMGLGFLLVDSQNNGRIDRMFLAILLLGILGKTTDALVGLLERQLLRRWGSA
ncbi:MAG TPA: ABC transporter permease [Naasia sp.]